jgi:hypothetical protein
MVYWHQLEGNNVELSGNDLAGDPKSPSYNRKMGFSDGELKYTAPCRSLCIMIFIGAQTDIFREAGTATVQSIPPVDTPTLTANADSYLILTGHRALIWFSSILLGILIGTDLLQL